VVHGDGEPPLALQSLPEGYARLFPLAYHLHHPVALGRRKFLQALHEGCGGDDYHCFSHEIAHERPAAAYILREQEYGAQVIDGSGMVAFAQCHFDVGGFHSRPRSQHGAGLHGGMHVVPIGYDGRFLQKLAILPSNRSINGDEPAQIGGTCSTLHCPLGERCYVRGGGFQLASLLHQLQVSGVGVIGRCRKGWDGHIGWRSPVEEKKPSSH